ncbi:MAG: DUF4199 domain-containing protein [Bacteroidales bacterium]|nr:DUF4199 domain-containing protein [Bacteroidales bacterium]
MENKVSIWKNSVNYGLIGGILMIALSVILWLTGMMENKFLGYISYLILAFAMYLGAVNWRDKSNDGWMTYGEAFKTGFFVTLIAALLGLIYSYVFFNFIDPDFIGTIMSKAEEAMLEANPSISDEDLDRALEMTSKFSSPTMLTVFGFIGTVIFGTLLSLIVAIFAKKVNPADAV